MNILMLSDSYKVSHYKQYPKNTTQIYSYFEARENSEYDKILFFGLQYFIIKYLIGEVVTKDKINEAEQYFEKHLGKGVFYKEGWEYILNKHQGRLPVKIKAVPEGTLVDKNNVLMTITNTDPNCYWLVNYLETLLVQVWYPTTVATLSYNIKKLIQSYLDISGDDKADFKLHNFGFRGSTSPESAGIGDLAHLINFKGSDSLIGLDFASEYYFTNEDVSYSIPATEHSTITSWGKENELEAYRNVLDEYPNGLVACVSDSYDIFNACENLWGDKLKEKIISRNGTLIIRFDSGNPTETLLKGINILFNKFGYYENSKGYKVLPPYIRILQGDGVNYNSIKEICQCFIDNKISIDNIAFGMGGALMQKVNRDTCSFAFKCSYAKIGDNDIDVYKDPITDKGKQSKKGKLKLIKLDGKYKTIPENISFENDLLFTVFEHGYSLPDELNSIRETVNNN